MGYNKGLYDKMASVREKLIEEGQLIPKPMAEYLARYADMAKVAATIPSEPVTTNQGRAKCAAALWLLGGSMGQIGFLFGVRAETIYSYVQRFVHPDVRKDWRSRPRATFTQLSGWASAFETYKESLIKLKPVQIAQWLQSNVETSEDEPNDPAEAALDQLSHD